MSRRCVLHDRVSTVPASLVRCSGSSMTLTSVLRSIVQGSIGFCWLWDWGTRTVVTRFTLLTHLIRGPPVLRDSLLVEFRLTAFSYKDDLSDCEI